MLNAKFGWDGRGAEGVGAPINGIGVNFGSSGEGLPWATDDGHHAYLNKAPHLREEESQ